jgi:cation diffusion facilitator family transporter
MHSHDHSAESTPQDHGHSHDHDHDSSHSHNDSVWNLIAEALHLPGHGHSHDRPAQNDPLYNNELGIRTVKVALLVLGVTTVLQIVIYLMSGSVALLADTVHNLGDALNSVPLWIAFVLARRAANKRYTYGYGRAEDIAGLLIVASIGFSAAYILWESIQKFINPEPLTNLPWVAAAAIIGFVGNEVVALLQIRVGRRIGSEAMITDGRHARADGLTSLAVLIAVGGTAIGFPLLDPIIGIVIGLAIVLITREAIVAVWHRMMDAVDPSLVERGEAVVRQHPQVKDIEQIRMRWVGHGLHIDLKLGFSANLSMQEIDAIIDDIGHELLHDIPNVADVRVVPVSWEPGGLSRERKTEHHIATG